MDPLLARWFADAVMSAHFAFVLFVVFGAALVLWRLWIAWLHVPCALYGLALEFYGWTCPLTPVEKSLRLRAGQGGYEGGFIEHYIGGLLYPQNWSEINHLLGVGLLAITLVLYGLVIARWRRERRDRPARTAARTAARPQPTPGTANRGMGSPSAAPQPDSTRSAAASRSGVPTSSQAASPTSNVASR